MPIGNHHHTICTNAESSASPDITNTTIHNNNDSNSISGNNDGDSGGSTKAMEDLFYYFVLPSVNKYAKVAGWILFPQWHYFRRLLDSGMQEATSRIITLPNNFPKRLLQNIIRLCHAMNPKPLKHYENAIFAIDSGAEFELIDNATKRPLPPFQSLAKQALEVLDKPLTEENCVQQLNIHAKVNIKVETERIVRYIAKRWPRIAQTHLQELTTLSPELLQAISAEKTYPLTDSKKTKKKRTSRSSAESGSSDAS